jgi:flagellar basal-body rod protein FlgG
MVKGLYTAWSGMINEQKRLDVLSNNLANADTNGYKKEGTTSQTFADELAYRIKDSSSYGLYDRKLGSISMGVHIGETYTDFSTGSFKVTDGDTDFALSDNGFFAIEFTDKAGNTSVKYTRDGAFVVNTQGYLVTKDGDYVLNQNGAMSGTGGEANYIKLDPNLPLTVDELGNIYQNDELVANLGVVDFEDYNYLSKYGENMYDMVEGGQRIASEAKVEQGTIESSNVNIISEMVDMITISRAYQAGQKVINTMDDSLNKAVNDVGKV